MKIGIFTTFQGNHLTDIAVAACKDLGVDCEVVDILSSDWIENVRKAADCDGFFCPSNCISSDKKNIQDERYYFVSQVMKRPIYPDYFGLYIHENKRNMAAFLELNNYPHVKTKVFTDRKDALAYLDTCSYPVVVKANVGAGASKVRIAGKSKAKRMCRKCFAHNDDNRFLFLNLGLLYSNKVKGLPFVDLHNIQKDYFLVQEYTPIKHEWRILKIGDSYFGHQKLLKGQFASGSGKVGWVAPPKELLLLVKDICDKGGFLCMDVDIFESLDGKYYVNELQASFGSFLDYQMKIDGKPGRYRYVDGEFVFEEGEFNVFNSNRLKIEHFVQLLSSGKL